MSHAKPLQVVIADPSANDAESVVSALRGAGYAAHAEHVTGADALAAALAAERRDLVICRGDPEAYDVAKMITLVRGADEQIPVLLLEPGDDPSRLASGLELGATDVILADQDKRLRLVIARELQNLQARRAVAAESAARAEAERHLELVLATANTAIGFVHDGMHVHANDAYVRLFGYTSEGDLAGVPLLDMVADDHQETVRERLRAFREEADDEPLAFVALRADGSRLPVRMALTHATFDGERCLQVLMHADLAGPEAHAAHGGAAADAESSWEAAEEALALDDAPETTGCAPGVEGADGGAPESTAVEEQALAPVPEIGFDDSDASAQAGSASANHDALLDHLRRAMRENNLVVLFQPVISLYGERGERYEVYLRVPGEEGELRHPREFVDAAEQAGLSGRLDRWVVLQAIKRLARHRSERRADTRLTINVSRGALLDKSFLSWLQVALKAAKVPRNSLALQLSEQTAAHYADKARTLTEGLAQLECEASLCRFRGESSSFSALEALTAQYVKLDPALVTNPENANSLASTIQAIDMLDKTIIVPMVDSAGTLARLFQSGANYVQGNYLQEPSGEMEFDFTMEL